MTICAAAVGPDGVWVGSDGRTVWDNLISCDTTPKWSVSPCGQWAVSHSGESGYRDVVELMFTAESFVWPVRHDRLGVLYFLQQVRAHLDSMPQGPKPFTRDGESFLSWGWAPIVATPLGIWHPDSTLWAVDGPLRDTFTAIGSGRAYALGAMVALHDEGCTSAERLVRSGIAAACALEWGCGGKVWIHSMPPPLDGAALAQAASKANGSGRPHGDRA